MNSLSVTGQRFCEMPLDIDLANDQLKLWDYKLLESVHTPIHDANASHGMQAVDTFTYSRKGTSPKTMSTNSKTGHQ